LSPVSYFRCAELPRE